VRCWVERSRLGLKGLSGGTSGTEKGGGVQTDTGVLWEMPLKLIECAGGLGEHLAEQITDRQGKYPYPRLMLDAKKML